MFSALLVDTYAHTCTCKPVLLKINISVTRDSVKHYFPVLTVVAAHCKTGTKSFFLSD